MLPQKMEHPLMRFFRVMGTDNVGASVQYPLGGPGRIRCAPCKRWYGEPDFREVEATVSCIPEGDLYEGSPAVDVGPDWPEAIEVSRGPLLVRGDVVEIMQESGVSGFIPHKVKLTINDDNAFARPIPEYFQIEITGRVAISNLEREVTICPICLSSTGRGGFGWMFVPLLETWSGDDLVKASNVASGYVLSTRKLIDLAKAEGWSSFQFESWNPHCRVNFLDQDDWHTDVCERIRLKYRHYFENELGEPGGAGRSATRPESKPEGDQSPKPESEGRSR